jgi:hypothetical protein
MNTNNATDRSFEELTKEEKLLALALYINHPIPQDFEQIRNTIKRNGWEELTDDDLNEVRINLVKSRLN